MNQFTAKVINFLFFQTMIKFGIGFFICMFLILSSQQVREASSKPRIFEYKVENCVVNGKNMECHN